MGGYSFERHISMESGRNIYEKLSSSEEFEPVPIFLTGNSKQYELYTLPLPYLLKDNADDIAQKILFPQTNEALEQIRLEAEYLREKYHPQGGDFKAEKWDLMELKNQVEGVFIALHGRPGEDGTLQKDLQEYGLYFNGSPSESSEITIDKYRTNEILRAAGFSVADHLLLNKNDFQSNPEDTVRAIIDRFGLPLIAKPADDGCSAAVRKIKSAQELQSFAELIFRETPELDETIAQTLNINIYDELPRKQALLIEKFIDQGDAIHFLEITGGMLTHLNDRGQVEYEMFEPSESLAESEILSLEEKFLAGEGQNLTPSRFSKDHMEQARISLEVQETLKKVAQVLKVEGYCRIDAFVRIFANGQVETVIIEVNSLPGMTPATCIYHQAALKDYKPFDFIKEILNFGRTKWQQESKRINSSI
jgi:D-alanine-D-alanine ligase